jgi:hypothetical protein
VQDANGRPQELGYPQAWLQDVVKLRPEQFKLPANAATKSSDSY